jgi:glycosyltransferase involved in cell wall biosynthesis
VGERELLLFPKCVQSIVESTRRVPDVELVVADWESDDWPLGEWLRNAAAPIPSRVISLQGTFSRGRGRNAAAAAAEGSALLFLDADSLLCPLLLESGLRYLHEGKAFFPIVYTFNEPEHRTGWWRDQGYGNCLVTRLMLERAGGWPDYEMWGKEDEEFFERISVVVPVVREEVPGFYHQWHPEEMAWKNRYGSTEGLEQHLDEHFRREQKEQARIRQTLEEIRAATAPGQTVILVNENQWAAAAIADRRVLPFLERDGEYWGPPQDDAEGIRELERLRQAGAQFVACAWPAFWWLEFYPRWHQHLCASFPIILKNDRLVLFDLRGQPR